MGRLLGLGFLLSLAAFAADLRAPSAEPAVVTHQLIAADAPVEGAPAVEMQMNPMIAALLRTHHGQSQVAAPSKIGGGIERLKQNKAKLKSAAL